MAPLSKSKVSLSTLSQLFDFMCLPDSVAGIEIWSTRGMFSRTTLKQVYAVLDVLLLPSDIDSHAGK